MRFSTRTIAASLPALALSASLAHAEKITVASPHSVATTIDRLENAVEAAGAKVFARIDHAAGAQSIGAELRPTTLLIFGNPRLGTPAIQGAQTIGLDLPLRALAFEDESGAVMLVYHDPADLAAEHGLPADAPVIAKMTGALKKLTGKATAAE